ncbi:2-amino-4-hydroxy-6-hydroxymethyldihydropteridine diphosphokinase [Acinetobacter sp. WZC-1]|uniref:2-amino-4-hydroxy-6- hydroxymethyldihydropteridine diphosphokinase n=1 Tax=Acinetobacter sp. WZC-1 TaxID=3459034 RepID=UPI00403E2242
MNVTETIFALTLASNYNPQQHFQQAIDQLMAMGKTVFSDIYRLPCRDGIGEDYWNAACLLTSHLSVDAMMIILKKMETDAGRVHGLHQISLDADVIAWGHDLTQMQFNLKKLPLALDVRIPMMDIWQNDAFAHDQHQFSVVSLDIPVKSV